MTKNVLISIKGLQFGDASEGEQIEVITPGSYYKKNDFNYVFYEEVVEGSEEITKNSIKFNNDFVCLTKRGFVNVEMIFEKNKKNMTNYITPYGALIIGIDANSIRITEEENKISISIDYSLDINYEHLADCKIEMMIHGNTEDSVNELHLL